MNCTHGCGGTGRLGVDLEVACPCSQESVAEALDRVTSEKLELARTVTELSLLVVDLETERDLLRAQVTTLREHRLKLLHAVEERAHAMQQAGHLDGAKRLMDVIREVADG